MSTLFSIFEKQVDSAAAKLQTTFGHPLTVGANESLSLYSGTKEPQETTTPSDRTHIGMCYRKVTEFLNSMQVSQVPLGFEAFGTFQRVKVDPNAMASLNIGDDLITLCKETGVPDNQITETCKMMASILSRFSTNDDYVEHWNSVQGSEKMSDSRSSMQQLYPSHISNGLLFEGTPSKESFGANSDTILPDIRMALTVALMKPHTGIMSRFMHRKASNAIAVQFVVNYDEFYRLDRSQNKESRVRNDHAHRIPMLELETHPEPTDMTLTRFRLLKANDPEDKFLVADDVMKFGAKIHMFDMAVDASNPSTINANWTDLVSDQIVLDYALVEISTTTADGSVDKSEVFQVDLSAQPDARLLMVTNTQESSERNTRCTPSFFLNKETKTVEDVDSEIFESFGVNDNDQAMLSLTLSPTADIRTGIVHCIGEGSLSHTVRDTNIPAVEAQVTAVAGMKVKLIGYSLDAKYSEENLRKANVAIRSLTHPVQYALPQGKAIVVDFSMQQTLPDHVMQAGQKAQALGIDYRDIQIIIKTMRQVHDRNVMESSENTTTLRSNLEGRTLNRTYLAGQHVNPTTIIKSLNLVNIVSIRSADLLGDIRMYVEAYLTRQIAELHQRSLYVQQLNPGEKPVYKVLTSRLLLETIFGIPHIHNHLHPKGMEGEQIYQGTDPSAAVEYTRVLPSGVVLQFITTAFAFMRDTVLIVPYREGDAGNILNFGQNIDGGQFASNYTPVDGNQVNRRMYLNTREYPIITNPSGLLIQVKGLSQIAPIITDPVDGNFLQGV